MSKTQTLGPIRILTTKYIDYQKHLLDQSPRIRSLNDSKSMLNDKGKIRYYILKSV